MKQCFEILGLNENATKTQVQEAYDRRATRYSSDLYLEDPKYAKKKLKELKKAYEEAYRLAESSVLIAGEEAVNAGGKTENSHGDSEETLEALLTDEELYMQKLYHKYLHRGLDKAAGINPDGPKGQRKANRAYKSNVLLFWLGVLGVIVLIGILL